MQTKVLIAYASKYGATEEISERIGLKLSQSGLQVDVLPVDDVHHLEFYEAIIIGSAVYMGQWRRSAVRFLKKHKQTLATKKVWLFSSGPTGKGDPVEILKGWKYPSTLQLLFNNIQPQDISLFLGHVNPEKMNLVERFIINKIKAPVGDFRNWEVIEAWAAKAAEEIHSDN